MPYEATLEAQQITPGEEGFTGLRSRYRVTGRLGRHSSSDTHGGDFSNTTAEGRKSTCILPVWTFSQNPDLDPTSVLQVCDVSTPLLQ